MAVNAYGSGYNYSTTLKAGSAGNAGGAYGAGTAATAQGAAAPAAQRQSDIAGLQKYIDAVDQNGNVDNNIIHQGALSTAQARTRIVEGYAAEFYAGGRLENVQEMSQNLDQIYKDLNSGDPQAQQAATFALVASKYKNAGGNYDNGQLKRVLEATGNQDLITGGVGDKDVQTLGAVTQALRRGTLSLDQIYGPDGKDVLGGNSVEDKGKYDLAIATATSGNLGANIAGDQGGGGGGGNKVSQALRQVAPDLAGNNDLLSVLMQLLMTNPELLQQILEMLGLSSAGAAGNAGNAGDAGNAGNAGDAGNAGNAGDAGNAGNAGDAGNAENAGDAGNAGNAGDAGNAENANNADNVVKVGGYDKSGIKTDMRSHRASGVAADRNGPATPSSRKLAYLSYSKTSQFAARR